MEVQELKSHLISYMTEDSSRLALINSQFARSEDGLGGLECIPGLAKAAADIDVTIKKNTEAIQAIIAAGLADDDFLALATKYGEILQETAGLLVKAIRGITAFEKLEAGEVQ